VATNQLETTLHGAPPGHLSQTILGLALEAGDATIGALFLWDKKTGGLVLAHQVVDGLTVTMPNTVLRPGSDKPGLALWVFEKNESYSCADTSRDPHYTRYLLEVGSMVAVPIRYQRKPIGVLTVSARERAKFRDAHATSIEEIAKASAKYIRRAQLDDLVRARTGRPFLIKGLSEAWLQVEKRIEQASPTNAPVLIRGESGTGKDLVANAIHFNSKRTDRPLVTVNCAAIPDTLLESTLFGHVKGAFTGASFQKTGEFQKADGGTLFLDEVGELPLMLQAKVLRAVEQGEVQPLGSNKEPEQVDVRLICATNRDLEHMAGRGDFREDLFYRLSVLTLELPPLRSYKDNLELLAHVFLQQAAEKHGITLPRFTPSAVACLLAYDYPGNVRQLKNAIEHATIVCGGDEICDDDLPPGFSRAPESAVAPPSTPGTLRALREEWLAPLEREYLVKLLTECGGNVRRAAERAGVNTVTLYRLLKKRGVELERQVRTA